MYYGDEVHLIRYTSPSEIKFFIMTIYKWRSLVLFYPLVL